LPFHRHRLIVKATGRVWQDSTPCVWEIKVEPPDVVEEEVVEIPSDENEEEA
jgi:hypothetical protein